MPNHNTHFESLIKPLRGPYTVKRLDTLGLDFGGRTRNSCLSKYVPPVFSRPVRWNKVRQAAMNDAPSISWDPTAPVHIPVRFNLPQKFLKPLSYVIAYIMLMYWVILLEFRSVAVIDVPEIRITLSNENISVFISEALLSVPLSSETTAATQISC